MRHWKVSKKRWNRSQVSLAS